MADILVVDDDDDIRDALRELLECDGHTVRVARDGIEGLAQLDARLPDLLLLDVEMPRLSGPQMATEAFLRDVGREKIPIVLLSAKLDLPRIAEIVGTPYYLGKPYCADALFRLIARACAERRPPTPSIGERRLPARP